MDEKKILLVEDNPDDEFLMLRALKKNMVANEIIVTRDGVQALDYLFCRREYAGRDVSNLPQLILLDLKLPKINGLEVLRQVRANENTKHIPIVILTSSLEDRDIINGYASGANSFVQKPIDFEEFMVAVQQLSLYWLVINKTVPER